METRPPKNIDLRLASALDEEGTVSFARTLVRPIGLLHGQTADAAVEAGAAAWMAGGVCAYTLIEFIEGQGAFIASDIHTAAQAGRTQAPQIRQRLALLEEPRQSLAGLTWSRPRILADMSIAGAPDAPGERSANAAVQHAAILAREGADIIALALSVPEAETAPERLAAAMAALADAGLRPGAVAGSPDLIRAAARAGARLIIDDATTIDEEALYALGDSGLPVVLRHAGPTLAGARASAKAGTKASGERNAIAREVHIALEDRIALYEGAGIPRARLIVDPGLGHGKSRSEALALVHDLALFHGLGCPLIVDLSAADIRSRRGARADAARETDAPSPDNLVHAVDLANAALRQGVQAIALSEPARAWRLVAAFCDENEARAGDAAGARAGTGDGPEAGGGPDTGGSGDTRSGRDDRKPGDVRNVLDKGESGDTPPPDVPHDTANADRTDDDWV